MFNGKLSALTDEELTQLQKSLGQYLDTAQENEARVLNTAIYNERIRRNGYGF